MSSPPEARIGWHVCTRCGYLAHSWPWTTYATRETDGVEITEGHDCPECGCPDWLSVEGLARPMRERIKRDGRWDLVWRTSGADYDARGNERRPRRERAYGHAGIPAMKALTVRVEDALLLSVKRRALDSGVSLQEVVTRLLTTYVDGGALSEGGQVESALLPPDESTAGTMADARHDAARRKRYGLGLTRCPATSSDGEQCRFRRGHDSTGEPHSWTRFGFGRTGR